MLPDLQSCHDPVTLPTPSGSRKTRGIRKVTSPPTIPNKLADHDTQGLEAKKNRIRLTNIIRSNFNYLSLEIQTRFFHHPLTPTRQPVRGKEQGHWGGASNPNTPQNTRLRDQTQPKLFNTHNKTFTKSTPIKDETTWNEAEFCAKTL